MYIAVILTIGIIILVHEAGHFAAARMAGIPVAQFSIGFGPALYKKEVKGTQYRIGIIPLGGYLLPAVSDEAAWFLVSPGRRILLSLGGPAANLLMALLFFSVANILRGEVSPYGIIAAPFVQLTGLITSMAAAVPALFSSPGELSGIVGIVAQGGKMIEGSLTRLIHFAILINANLALLNLLPIPALDGGKILLTLLEKIHPRLRSLQVPLGLAGWIAIMGLMVYVTALDVGRLIS